MEINMSNNSNIQNSGSGAGGSNGDVIDRDRWCCGWMVLYGNVDVVTVDEPSVKPLNKSKQDIL